MRLRRAARTALERGRIEGEEARKFFEEEFWPARIAGRGFVTGYYEPELAASLQRGGQFTVPLYRRPTDLIEVDDANRPPGMDPEIRFARRISAGIVEYFDRAAIEEGALAGQELELAFVESAADAFFIHVQGSARLRLVGGGTLRIAFDGKSGHPYTSIGRLAVERGLLRREDAHKQGLEAWLKANEAEGRALMRENRSFIFFKETAQSEDQGPLGAAGVPLTAGRSLAVDRTLVTFHTPVWVEAPELADPGGTAAGFPPLDDRAGYRFGDRRAGTRRHLLRLRRCRGRAGKQCPACRADDPAAPEGRRAAMSRRLTREDRELWERLKSSVKPLRPEQIEAKTPAAPKATEAAAKRRVRRSQGRDAGEIRAPPPPPPAPSALEQRKLRRLARGLAEVEARIDLHGMRQERAFARLIAFLREHQARDARLVLVITGKGLDGGSEGRGVLKQVVPMWLSRPEFRDLVVGFSDAGRRHGGSGALYVQLRRRVRARAAAS